MHNQESRKKHRFVRAAALPAGLFLCACAGSESNRAPPDMVIEAQPEGYGYSPEADNPAMLEAPPPKTASVEPPRIPRVRARRQPPVKKQPAPRVKEPLQATPNVAINDLIGSDFTSILHVFRYPDAVQNNAPSVVWIYSPPGCTLQLYFYPDIQTTRFHLLKYDLKNAAGEMLGAGDECMRLILAPRSRGAALP